MKFTICLAKTTVIFYSVLAPLIIVGSLYNVIEGVILHRAADVHIGAFSLFGFVLLPLLIAVTYIKNKCVIERDNVRIGKVDFKASAYSFAIKEFELPFKERPLFSLWKKTYSALVIQDRRTGEVALEKELAVFEKDIEKMRAALPR